MRTSLRPIAAAVLFFAPGLALGQGAPNVTPPDVVRSLGTVVTAPALSNMQDILREGDKMVPPAPDVQPPPAVSQPPMPAPQPPSSAPAR